MALAALQRSVFVPSSRSPRPPRGPVRPAMAGANADVAPSPPLPVKLFATLKTDATAHTSRPHPLRVLRGATWRQTSIGQGPTTRPACSPRQLLIPVGFCESEPQQKDGQNLDCRVPKDRRNIVEGQPPHNLRVRSRRQRYVHTRARLPATRPARRHAGAVRSSTTLLIRTALRWSAAACCTQAPPPAPPSQQW